MRARDSLTIIEGPDGAGKSTLIEKLQDVWGSVKMIHHGAYPGVTERELPAKYLHPMLQRSITHLIYDRSWCAEPIYGAAMRGGADRIGIGWRRMLERVALSERGVVVLALPPYSRCLATFAARRDREYLDHVEKLKRVYNGYLQLKTALPMFRYDYESMSLGDVRRLLEQHRPTLNLGPGIGRWAPGEVTLLVGERSNDVNALRYPKLVFVSSRGGSGGCGPWFAEQLEKLGVGEDQLYWVNAVDPRNIATDPKFIEQLQPKRVIALGGVAASWCKDIGVEAVEIEHPQYWKRFHHHEPWGNLRRAFNHLTQEKTPC